MKSILVVDDNMVSLKQICAQLAETYEVSLAKSGELALQICAQEKPLFCWMLKCPKWTALRP